MRNHMLKLLFAIPVAYVLCFAAYVYMLYRHGGYYAGSGIRCLGQQKVNSTVPFNLAACSPPCRLAEGWWSSPVALFRRQRTAKLKRVIPEMKRADRLRSALS